MLSIVVLSFSATPGTTTQHDFTHPVDKLTGLTYQTVASK